MHAALAARRTEKLEELARPAILACDLYEDDVSRKLAASAQQALGRVDILVNNAGPASEFAAFIAREQKIWSDIVQRAQIKAD